MLISLLFRLGNKAAEGLNYTLVRRGICVRLSGYSLIFNLHFRGLGHYSLKIDKSFLKMSAPTLVVGMCGGEN